MRHVLHLLFVVSQFVKTITADIVGIEEMEAGQVSRKGACLLCQAAVGV